MSYSCCINYKHTKDTVTNQERIPLPVARPPRSAPATARRWRWDAEVGLMRIICMDCGKPMGEKCPQCGAQPLEVRGKFHCQNCGYVFEQGQGGTTHSLCEPCRMIRREREIET